MLVLAALVLSACIPTAGWWRWWWDRSPETDVVSYRVEAHYAEAFHYSCPVCCDDSMPCERLCDSTCVSYTSTIPFLASTEPQPAGGTEVCTEWDAGPFSGTVIPSLDSVLFVNVRAVDSAGNVGN